MTLCAVIGLEVHAQLVTASKLFCRCATTPNAPANSLVCPTCAGHPGTLPNLNAEAVRLGLRVALALGATVAPCLRWDRKHYFYPDLPKGYQITQHATPLATGGRLQVATANGTHDVALRGLHLEEDAGKSLHGCDPQQKLTGIDLNRCGVPLVEIVTEPVLRSGHEASAAARSLRTLLVWLEACAGHLEDGQLRVDANVSLATKDGAQAPRVELKNLNSFRFLEAACDAEATRQRAVLASGGQVHNESRAYNSASGETVPMRSKESSHAYRYVPEPDLPPLLISPQALAQARESLPTLPLSMCERFQTTRGLPFALAHALTQERALAHYVTQALPQCLDARLLANLVLNTVAPARGGTSWEALPLTPTSLAKLCNLVSHGIVSHTAAKELLPTLLAQGGDPASLAEQRGLKQCSDDAWLAELVTAVLDAEPAAVARYQQGKPEVLGFLVGRVLQQSGGRANPRAVAALLRTRLTAHP